MVVQIFETETEIEYFLFDLKISTTLNKIKYINSFGFFVLLKNHSTEKHSRTSF